MKHKCQGFLYLHSSHSGLSWNAKSRHANQFGRNMDFDHATIVGKAADYHKTLFLEAWHSKRPECGE